MTTLQDAIASGAARLAAAGIGSARLDARVLLAFAMDKEPDDLVSDWGPLPPAVAARFEDLIARRAAREPVAYLTGRREFWSLSFAVGPGVLVPRPETETLLEEALKAFPDRAAPLKVLDLGTGSGCLLIACLATYRRACGEGIDASPDALVWARKNAARLGVAERCRWHAGDWSEARGRYDVVFCNPPYLRADEAEGLAPDVRLYEPAAALFASADGLAAYRAVAPVLDTCLSPHGRAFLELGAGQETSVRTILEAERLEIVGVASDLMGIPRCIAVKRRMVS